MIAKAGVLLGACLCVSASPPPVIVPTAVVRVACMGSFGTAFRIGPRLLVSVKHVSSNSGCFIENEPFEISYTSPDRDFSILRSRRPGPYLPIDCGGYVAGRPYVARGYARGLPVETAVELIATGKSTHGLDALWGIFTVIPGQSGGPVVDKSTGKAVGTVNAYNMEQGISGSVPLSETVICSQA